MRAQVDFSKCEIDETNISKERAKALDEIASGNSGRLRAADVVKRARDKKSPLHDAFEWDDSAAAQKYRLQQAEDMIRKYKIIVHDRETKKVMFTIRAYHSLTEDRDGGGGEYRHANEIFANERLQASLLDQAKRELVAVRNKYAALSALSSVWSAIDSLEN